MGADKQGENAYCLIWICSRAVESTPSLVTTKPEQALPSDAEGYRRLAWLGTRQPITVLP